MNSVDLYNFPTVSKLFVDYCQSESFINKYFPNNIIIENKKLLSQKAENFPFRNELHIVLVNSMKSIDLSEKQTSNLEHLNTKQSLAVVTGQQVGFLGGPAYTIYKALSVIILSDKLNKNNDNLNFIPIFWVEDNDHDYVEASKISIYNDKYDILNFNSFINIENTSAVPVASRKFDDDIVGILDQIENALPQSLFKEEIVSFLKEIYKPGKSWNNVFIQFLNKIFADKGLLFIKASETLKSSVFQKLIFQELNNIGQSKASVEKVNNSLICDSYHIQAKVTDINLFLEYNGKRNKLNFHSDNNSISAGETVFSREELLDIADNHPEYFSPNALMRPLFQDFIIPNIAYIAGPGEIAYLSQTLELYKYFHIDMPSVLPRLGATILDKRISRILSSENLNPNYFYKSFQEIESQLSKILENEEIKSIITNLKNIVNSNYTDITNKIIEMDKSFDRTAGSSLHNVIKELDNLEKKTLSVQKKYNEVLFKKYYDVSQMLFPNNKLQERVFSVINFINLYGFKEFKEKIFSIDIENKTKHFYL
jgi:bacillithiol synthase